MAQDRAVFWLCVVLLLGAGMVVGQLAAISIGAMTSLVLTHYADGMWSG
jgi:hypothetical protein